MNPVVQRWLADDSDLTVEELTELLRRRVPAHEARSTSAEVHQTLQRADGFGPLTRLLASDDVNDICINGPGEVLVDAGGKWRRSGIVLDAAEVRLLVERLLATSGRRLDRLHPLVDARLSDGSRINAAGPPVAINGPVVTIRRFKSAGVPLEGFGTPDHVAQLRAALQRRDNILISGPTGSGKTSLVAALLDELDPSERVVLVEDTAELPATSAGSVRLETRPALSESNPPVTLRDLVRNALRMRPDRIVVGEVRGAEALDLLLALNTGHRGCLATCHGSGARKTLSRLGLLASLDGVASPESVRSMTRDGLDLVVHLERDGAERRIVETHVPDEGES